MEDYQTTITFLSEPVDVYNDWIDACETANWYSTKIYNLIVYVHLESRVWYILCI